jgi:hypothetical protein
MSTRPGTRTTTRAVRQRGTTILDGVMALGIAACGLAAMAPLLMACTRAIADARAETRALALASSRLEQLKAALYEQDAATLSLVTDTTTNFAQVPPSNDGSGLAPGDAATAWADTPGFVDWADREGAPVTRPRGAAFVRRWSVTRVAAAGGVDSLALVVFARDLAREGSEPPRASPIGRPGDVWLFTVRARGLR